MKKKFHALCQRKSAKHQISTNPFFQYFEIQCILCELVLNKNHYYHVMIRFYQILMLRHLQKIPFPELVEFKMIYTVQLKGLCVIYNLNYVVDHCTEKMN